MNTKRLKMETRVKRSAVQPFPQPSKTMFDLDAEKESLSLKSEYYSTYNHHHFPTLESPTKRAIKNIICLGSAFMFTYTAFVSLQSLQSSMNAESGRGVASLCSIYASTVISCFLAPWIIYRLTSKWTILAGQVLFLLYIATHFNPLDFMIIPTSILLGLLVGPLWIAQATYLTTTAYTYSAEKCQIYEKTVGKFNGMFCCVFQLSQIWGNMISALVLHDDATVELNNKSLHPHPCGAQDCGLGNLPNTTYESIANIPTDISCLLLSIYIGCAILGIVIVITLVDNVRTPIGLTWQSNATESSRTMVLATLNMFRDGRFCSLIPLVLFTGLEQGFIFGDFTKSYVNCALGIHKIGTVMVVFGGVTAASAFTIGHLSKHIKRFFIVLSGALFHGGLLIVLLLWKPGDDDLAMFYVVAGCLGLCDAIWQTQSTTLFGVLFTDKQEAAFAAYRIFQSLGFALAFGYSYFLCVQTKLYILSSVLVTALLLYSGIEIRMKRQHTSDMMEMTRPIDL